MKRDSRVKRSRTPLANSTLSTPGQTLGRTLCLFPQSLPLNPLPRAPRMVTTRKKEEREKKKKESPRTRRRRPFHKNETNICLRPLVFCPRNLECRPSVLSTENGFSTATFVCPRTEGTMLSSLVFTSRTGTPRLVHFFLFELLYFGEHDCRSKV